MQTVVSEYVLQSNDNITVASPTDLKDVHFRASLVKMFSPTQSVYVVVSEHQPKSNLFGPFQIVSTRKNCDVKYKRFIRKERSGRPTQSKLKAIILWI